MEDSAAPTWTVGELARRTGVSVRTLHHYDATGLLVPSGRTPSGYRVYGEPDLERLQRVLAYRALGFALDDVRRLVDDPAADTVGHLRRQLGLAREQQALLRSVITTLETTMEAHVMGIRLTPEEMVEVFGDPESPDHPLQYAEEAQERWGDSDEWRESHRRTSAYGRADWQRVKEEQERVLAGYAEAYRAGLPATSAAAMDAAEAHRRSIDGAFYPCSHEMHSRLGEMYVADPRFTAAYERVAPGLASWVRDAILANGRREEQ